jgi:PAS domain S-box-containing protein
MDAGQKFNIVWLPVLIGSLLFISTCLFAWILDQQNWLERKQAISYENAKIATLIEYDLKNRMSTIERVVRLWEINGGLSQTEFTTEVEMYLNDVPGLQSVGWVDPGYELKWVLPAAGNEAAQNINLAVDSNTRLALELSKNTDSQKMTIPLNLVQGGLGFHVYFPIYQGNKFGGFIIAIFKYDNWLDQVLNSQRTFLSSADLRSSVMVGGTPVYSQQGWGETSPTVVDAVSVKNVLQHQITVQTRPTDAYMKSSASYLPLFVLGIGTFLSLLVGSMVRLNQLANVETQRSYLSRAALETEIQDHQRTAGELKETLSRLDMATKAGGIGVWSWHVPTNFMNWNDRMYTLFDTPPDVRLMYNVWRDAIHPDDLEATEARLNSAIDGKALFNTEFRIVLSSGAVRYLGTAARVERDFTGRAMRVNGISWDLTDLKQAGLTLQKSEEQVRLLLNSTAEAIYGIDLEGNCTFANPSCVKLLGYADASYLLGKNMHWLTHHTSIDGKSIPADDCSIFKAVNLGVNVHRDDEVFWRVDKTSFPVEYWSYPQMVNGKVSGAVVTFLDITERKHADYLLATERRRLSDILEGTNVGTYEWNVQTGDMVVNQRWADMIGYSLEELEPVSIHTLEKFIHPDDLPSAQETRDKHFYGELNYYECEFRLYHKEGFWVWVSDRGRLSSRTEDGKPLLMSGTYHDITQSKVMENVLRQSEEQNRALLSAMPDLIFRIRRDGNIVDFKVSSDELLVIHPNKIIGSSVYNILDENSALEAKLCISRAMETGQMQSMEYSMKIGDSTRMFESRFKNSGTDEVIAIIRDISEQRRLEQMKSDFINRATHELRTPIATMVLMVDLIEGMITNEEIGEYWNVLKGELNRERMLVEDLLSAGRLESDRFQFNFRLIDVEKIITATVQQFEPAAREKEISVVVESALPEGSRALVNGDENALNQVFVNLVSNAIKFTLLGGKVRIRIEKEAAGLKVSIVDTGIGIPSEDRPMLFNRFFRGTNAVQQEIQGTGIGLFIVRSILDKHGGKVAVASSEVDKGSQFDVWLPLVEPEGGSQG